jgi:hypothetical protein
LIVQELNLKVDRKKVSILQDSKVEGRMWLRRMMRNWTGQRGHGIEAWWPEGITWPRTDATSNMP